MHTQMHLKEIQIMQLLVGCQSQNVINVAAFLKAYTSNQLLTEITIKLTTLNFLVIYK